MSERTRKQAVIIGGGFSGTVLAIQLLRAARDLPLDVIVLERYDKSHRGVAYSTDNRLHLLNVPAEKMSAFPDEPNSFVDWLKRRSVDFEPGFFAPRPLYGDYLEDLFLSAKAEFGDRLRYEHSEAVDLRQDGLATAVILADGRILDADVVVLAIGNYPPANPSFVTEHVLQSGRYIGDPWRANCLAGIHKEDSILIIGTGLTMVDKIVELRRLAHLGPITAVSRRGLLPRPHKLGVPLAELSLDFSKGLRASAVLKLVRSAIEDHLAKGGEADWRGVVDALRPHTQAIWQSMPIAEKRRFLNHVRPYWEILRHRVPPPAQIVLDKMVESGQLKTMAATITRIVPKDKGSWVWLRAADTGQTHPVDVDWIINCSGSGPDFRRRTDPLTLQLFASGIATPGDVGIGLMVTANGELIDRYGRVQRRLLTLGPPMKGLLWESTAVPEIRVQAKALAEHIAKLLGSPAKG